MTAKYKTPSQLHSAMTCGGVTRLQTIFKAAYAVEAAQVVATAMDEDGYDLEGASAYHAGGLGYGIEVLSVLIQETAEELLGWMGATPWDGVPDEEESEQHETEDAA